MIVVFVLRLASDTVAGIRQKGAGLRACGAGVKSVPHNPVWQPVVFQRGCQGAVCVQAEDGLGHAPDSLPDVGQRVRDLAVALQLIPEEVCHNDNARLQLAEDSTGGCLVAFNHGGLLLHPAEGIRIHHKFCNHAAHEVCAGAVGKVRDAGLPKCLLDHAGTGCFAVGSRHGDGGDIVG